MTVEDLIKRLENIPPQTPLTFYRLDNHNLEEHFLETVLFCDDRAEITIQSLDHMEAENDG